MIQLDKLAYSIVDHCNLDCYMCGFFAPQKDKKEIPVEQFEKEMRLFLSKINLRKLTLTGGEPTLHSNICNIMAKARELMPTKSVRLYTNGIKLKSMPDIFWDTLIKYSIRIKISKYTLPLDYEWMEQKVKNLGISYGFEPRPNFANFIDPTGKQDPHWSWNRCVATCKSPHYTDEKIYMCSYSENVPLVNKLYKYNIEQDYVTIHDSEEVIDAFLNRSCSTCKYCKFDKELMPWRRIRDEKL